MNTHGHEQVFETGGFLPLLHFGNGHSLSVYFLVISLTFCGGILWLIQRARRFDFERNTVLDLCLVLMVTGFSGARLLHVFFEEPKYYLQNPIEILSVWQGGFVYYGGLIGAAIGAAAFFRLRRLSPGLWLDLFAPVFAAGYGVGRIACFLTGCCFGAACHTPWGAFQYPTQLFAVFWELTAAALLLKIESNRKTTRAFLQVPGAVFFFWLVLHGFGRILMELFRADDRGSAPLGLSLATWISLALIVGSTAILVRRSKNGTQTVAGEGGNRQRHTG